MPLLTMSLGVHVAAPLVALLSVTIAAGILVHDWHRVQWASAWRLIVSSLVGIPVGIYLLTSLPETAVKAGLAVVVIAFSTYCLWRPHRFTLRSESMSPVFGLAAGVLGGAYNTHGVPVVVYGTLRKWSAEKFRATMQGFFFPTSLMIVGGHAVSGRLTREVLWLYAVSLPLAVIALAVGGRLNRGALARHFVRWVHVALIVIGLSLLMHASWRLLDS